MNTDKHGDTKCTSRQRESSARARRDGWGDGGPRRQGKTGRKGFRRIVNDARFRSLPGCLETPKSEDMHEDVENLAIRRPLMKTWLNSPRSG